MCLYISKSDQLKLFNNDDQELRQSCSLFTDFESLKRKFFKVNDIQKLYDPSLFFNRKLNNLATSFMKKIQQDLIEICLRRNISFEVKNTVTDHISRDYKREDLNYYISQSSNVATIKCLNRNIFVNIDALKRSEYFRLSLEMRCIISLYYRLIRF